MQKVIHRKKLFGGRYTAEEVHQKYAFPPSAKCAGCGGKPLMRAIVMMEISEAKKNPVFALQMAQDPEGFFKTLVEIKSSDGKPKPYCRISKAYACKRCSPSMEKQLAKAPSHCIVEFNRGPDPDKIMVGYGS